MTVSVRDQLESVQKELLAAYMTRDDAEQKIKALRNVLQGVVLGRAAAAEEAAAPQTGAADELPGS